MDLAFARLALLSEHAEDAAAHARAAMNAFAAAGREGGRLEAAALLARALIARGNIDEASVVLAQVPSPDGKSFPIEAVVRFRIARCLAAAANGHPTEACRAMDTIGAEVSRLGLPPPAKKRCSRVKRS
jgi:thioredoxin-like negative regulator of GroEL